jgi:hypothetical protein
MSARVSSTAAARCSASANRPSSSARIVSTYTRKRLLGLSAGRSARPCSHAACASAKRPARSSSRHTIASTATIQGVFGENTW